MFHITTLNDVLRLACRRGDRRVMQWQAADGTWQMMTGDELYDRVRRLTAALQARGVERGDRVALLAENRWEWPVIDFAVLALGAVDVPLYPTVTAEQVTYMLRDSGAKVAFVSSQVQLAKLPPTAALPALQHVVVLDGNAGGSAESFGSLIDTVSLESLGATGAAAFDQMLSQVSPQDLATIIYTSGTTGEPKGVMLTHENFAANLNVSTDDLDFNESDSCISFLPLSHVTARHVDYALLCHGASLAYCPKFDQLPAAMKVIRPTVFVGVPRVFEKIRQAVEGKAAASSVRSRLLSLALSVGRQHREETLRGAMPSSVGWKLASRLVLSKISGAFGGRVKIFIAGGAPLGTDTAGWFADAGIRILEGYGLTETSPVIALNTPRASRMGSVGRLLKNVSARFAADGELEVQGQSVFSGYWQNERETKDAFSPDGWFRTGDIGQLDQDGFLFITDRKKELLKTSGGKLIAPQPIENRLKANVLVAQAALVGDKQRFAAVLISPNFEALEGWARGKGIDAADRETLVTQDSVRQLYEGVVEGVNRTLAQYETIKKLMIVPDEWSVESGELTPSLKLKRRVVEKNYADKIRELYKV